MMRVIKGLLVVSVAILCGSVPCEGQRATKCPPAGSKPKYLWKLQGKSGPLEYKLKKGRSDALCTLVHIKHSDPTNTTEVTVENNSPGADYILQVIGRSYGKTKADRVWEVSGSYSNKFEVIEVFDLYCTVRFNEIEPGFYFLMTSTYDETSFNKTLSRFFMQTTFGPTKDLLSQFSNSYSPDFRGMVQWVKDQMDTSTVPPTKHREYYRRKADYPTFNNEIGFSNIEVQHPCSGYSRWREHAFNSNDARKNFDVYYMGPAQFLVVIDGVARTVMNDFRSSDNVYQGAGFYEFDFFMGPRVGGWVRFRGRGCNCEFRDLEGGNPKVNAIIIDETWRNLFGSQIQYINLPDKSNFEQMPETIAPGWGTGDLFYDNASLRMNIPNGIFDTNPACEVLGGGINFKNVVGILATTYETLFFEGYAHLQENTIENPIPDGGAYAASAGAHNCANVAMNYENYENCFLADYDACESSSHSHVPWKVEPKIKKNTVICGSDGEVANERDMDPSEAGLVQPFGTFQTLNLSSYTFQKHSVPYMVFMKANDQLRQRVAWALSQILVITPLQISTAPEEAEVYLNYFDIFVKHAFGNYRDILKAVSYSPMMAEMLSYLESKSASYVLSTEGRISRPDENFAREIMQLFSIGLYKLNLDGTMTLDSNGVPLQTYTNSDIQTFARAWTGFRRENVRFNRDGIVWTENRLDPMAINGRWRDPFPKMDLDENFIGDGYPLCIDLPNRHFLRRGATYRLLGSAERAEMQTEPVYIDYSTADRFTLDPSSKLYEKLCNMNGGKCSFSSQIRLDQNLACHGKECEIDNLSVVIVQNDAEYPVKYEYVRPPCVEYAFYDSTEMKKIVNRYKEAMCLHENIDDVAMDACCPTVDPNNFLFGYADIFCEYGFERTSYSQTQNRCQTKDITGYPSPATCDWTQLRLAPNGQTKPSCLLPLIQSEVSWHWTNQSCAVTAKVNAEGLVSIVHNPNLDINTVLSTNDQEPQTIYRPVNVNNLNYFKVKWNQKSSTEYPSTANKCANNKCQILGNACICDVVVRYARVFSSMPKKARILKRLKIGHAPPESYDENTYTLAAENVSVKVYQKVGEEVYSKDSFFGIVHNGEMKYFKNEESSVRVDGTKMSFRNPVQFLNIAKPDTRDAMYETEALLDFYFHHTNVAPFLSTLMIKRFGISNPTPRYTKVVATAFVNGRYKMKKQIFGDGTYGNLGAMVAAIVLDREARDTKLDTDPSSGSLREPLIKLIGVLRAMEYKSAPNFPPIVMTNLLDKIGQETQLIPNVFSFFLPDFSPPGKIAEAKLTAPEAQVLNAPKILGFLNGLYSLIDLGMTACFGGFGDKNTYSCDSYFSSSPEVMASRGYLTFTPSGDNPTTEEIVDEMALLLTGGNINIGSRSLIIASYNEALQNDGQEAALKVAQKLFVSTPEFHTANTFGSISTPRPSSEPPIPSDKPYKAIVYINLSGGLDSFNVLVPHSDCQGDTDGYTMYDKYASVRGQVALRKRDLHTITATDQVCLTFGIHPNLPFVKALYDDEELLFFSNVGYLSEPSTTKENWRQTTGSKTALFSHNTQQDEINVVDHWGEKDGRGIGGRMLDILALKDYNPGSISLNGIATALRSENISMTVSDASGYQKFNPLSELSGEILDKVRELNNAASISSSFYGETWAESLTQMLDENELLSNELANIDVDASFPDSDLGKQLQSVAKLMKTKDVRGTDRDFFYTSITGFDMHSKIEAPLIERLNTINGALEAFATEMKDHQNIWDDVVVVVVSEFARTLRENSSNGTDHAWGGNYFVASGSAAGGQILGTFPDDLSNEGPYVTEGIVIPTAPWESLWNGIAEWFGVSGLNDLTSVLPNRNAFTNLWTASDIFKNT